MLCSDCYHLFQLSYRYRWPWQKVEVSLRYALAVSAIKRGDCAELQAMLDQGVDLGSMGDRFNVIPLDVAARVGDRDIVKLITDRGCQFDYNVTWGNANAVTAAARSGNKSL